MSCKFGCSQPNSFGELLTIFSPRYLVKWRWGRVTDNMYSTYHLLWVFTSTSLTIIFLPHCGRISFLSCYLLLIDSTVRIWKSRGCFRQSRISNHICLVFARFMYRICTAKIVSWRNRQHDVSDSGVYHAWCVFYDWRITERDNLLLLGPYLSARIQRGLMISVDRCKSDGALPSCENTPCLPVLAQ